MKMKKKNILDSAADNKNIVFGVCVIIFVFFICLLPLINKKTYSVTEDTDGLVITCPDSAVAGEIVECDIKVNAITMNVSGISANYKTSNGMIYEGFEFHSSWNRYEDVSYFTEEGFVLVIDTMNGSNIIGKVKYRLPDDATANDTYKIELVDIIFGDGETNELEISDAASNDIMIKELSDVNTLDSITISNGTLNETFDKNVNNYTALVDSNTFSVNVTKTSDSSIVSGIEDEYTIGDNQTITIEIKVTSESGLENVYTIDVTKEKELSNVNTLENIIISNGTLNETFDKNVNNYTALVDSNTFSVNVTKTSDSSIVSGIEDEYTISDNQTIIIEIKVTSESGLENIYTLTVNKKKPQYSLTFYSGLNVDLDNKYIKYVPVGTNLTTLLKYIRVVNGEIKLYNVNGNEKDFVTAIASGDVLRIYSEQELKDEYVISILGDSNGDGRISSLDLVQARKHLVGFRESTDSEVYMKTGIYMFSIDLNEDGKISTLDILRFRKIIAGVE